MKNSLIAVFAVAALLAGAAHAQTTPDTIKIGVLNDMTSLYADNGGPGSVVAANMAVDDFGGTVLGKKIEIINADHQNKPDIGASIARQWFDEQGVQMIADVPTSSVGLAVQEVARATNKVVINSGSATSDLTGKACAPTGLHWVYNTVALANGTGAAVVKAGGDTWFFITADYAFGHALERDTTAVIQANGGKVLGSVNVPLNNADFSSFLLQAQQSKAKIIGLANAGGDTDNSIKQGAKFGIAAGGQHFAGLLVFITDVEALGLKVAQGLVLTETWYWDMTDANRAWTKRWPVRVPAKFPNMSQAGVYSAVTHYLKAVSSLKSAADGKAVVAKMKERPTDDPLFGKGSVRADGREIHPAYLFEVKKPEESKYPGDYYKLLATIPADEAFRPLKNGNCPLVTRSE